MARAPEPRLRRFVSGYQARPDGGSVPVLRQEVPTNAGSLIVNFGRALADRRREGNDARPAVESSFFAGPLRAVGLGRGGRDRRTACRSISTPIGAHLSSASPCTSWPTGSSRSTTSCPRGARAGGAAGGRDVVVGGSSSSTVVLAKRLAEATPPAASGLGLRTLSSRPEGACRSRASPSGSAAAAAPSPRAFASKSGSRPKKVARIFRFRRAARAAGARAAAFAELASRVRLLRPGPPRSGLSTVRRDEPGELAPPRARTAPSRRDSRSHSSKTRPRRRPTLVAITTRGVSHELHRLPVRRRSPRRSTG